MTTVLGFDTATDDTAVAIVRDGEILSESLLGPDAEGGRPLHGVALLPEIERAAEAAGGWKAVDVIAVGAGPGSFTGLRVGIATARALGSGAGVDVRAVDSLATLARGAADSARPGRSILAVIDARRGEVFAALHDASGSRVWGPVVCAPGALVDRLEAAAPPLAAGSGALRFRGELSASGVEIPAADSPLHRIAGRHLCLIAAGGGGSAEISPLYLRKPDAERWHERSGSKKT